ncbi:MAG: VOC family protein [Nevskiaceae bacterium]|jgi:predicted enzyme related to lactoylglutathione lyase|nr:VOC family protein [Nevskiaceae bacterium]
MTKLLRQWLGIGALMVLAAAAHADVSLNGVRIGAKDTASLAQFYQKALVMQEVQRIQTPQFLEVMLNFGATKDAAMANRAKKGGDLVIMTRPADDGADTMAHVVFDVTDIDATVKAWKAAGGKMQREPFAYGDTGIRIGMGVDPAGNIVEFIQPAPAK